MYSSINICNSIQCTYFVTWNTTLTLIPFFYFVFILDHPVENVEDQENTLSGEKSKDVAGELKDLLDECFDQIQLVDMTSLHYGDGGEDVTGWRITPCQKKTEDAEPKYRQFTTVDSRVKTFKGVKIPQKRQLLAEAGLFYMGVKDHVQCFCCGGTLRDWKKGLDPFYEHAGWYGHCLFMKAIRGQEFVESCSKSAEAFVPYIQQAYPV